MSSVSSAAPSGQPSKEFWARAAPYVVPPLSGGVSVVLIFRDLIAKSALQKGLPIQKIAFSEGIKKGVWSGPIIGAIIGFQLIFQEKVEQEVEKHLGKKHWAAPVISSGIVGVASAPFLAVFNGRTMEMSMRDSLRNFRSVYARLCPAIAAQETAFIGGVSIAKRLSVILKRQFGDHSFIDYMAALISGSAGSLIGHPANTAITRWQSGLVIESFPQLWWGAARRARAIGCFSVFYQFVQKSLKPTS